MRRREFTIICWVLICTTVIQLSLSIIRRRNSSCWMLQTCNEDGGDDASSLLDLKDDVNFSTPIELNYQLPVAADVVYVWCGPSTRRFEFRHYLSVRSVFRHIRPDSVRFYYENKPEADGSFYYTWLTELSDQFPFFILEPVPSRDWCPERANDSLRSTLIGLFLDAIGSGIYIREDVILVRFDVKLRRYNQPISIYDASGTVELIRLSGGKESSASTSGSSRQKLTVTGGAAVDGQCRRNFGGNGPMGNEPWKGTLSSGVPDVQQSSNVEPKVLCLSTSSVFVDATALIGVGLITAATEIYPADIWELRGHVGRALRDIAYDDPTYARPATISHAQRKTPNIAHMIWTSDRTVELPFYHFLCILSAIRLARFDVLYIHGDGSWTGRYWDVIKDDPSLRRVPRSTIDHRFVSVYGSKVSRREQHSDIWRADILYKYGGMYLDLDAMCFKPIDSRLRSYDAVVAPHVPIPPWPGTLMTGVLLGRPGVEFFRLFQQSMKRFVEADGLFNGIKMPYKIKELHPRSIKVDPQLQIWCYDEKCYPTAAAGEKDHTQTGSLENWFNATHCIHTGLENIKELASPEALFANNGRTLFGKLGLFVLRQTGMYDYFNKTAR